MFDFKNKNKNKNKLKEVKLCHHQSLEPFLGHYQLKLLWLRKSYLKGVSPLQLVMLQQL